MSSGRKVAQLHPTTVTYRNHIITLKHRPKTNDWTYTVTHNIPLTLSNHAPRYETALNAAKAEIDQVLDKQR